MADCYQFAEGSRQRQICDGESELPLRRVNAFRALYGVGPLPGETAVDGPSVGNQPAPQIKTNRRAPRAKGGCCGRAAKPANGAVVNKKPVQQIAARPTSTKPSRIRPAIKPISLLSRAAQYATAMAKHIADDGSPSSPDTLAYRESCCLSCPQNIDNECSLCGCPLVKNMLNDGKLAWRSESCPAGRWFRQTNGKQSLVSPVRNLVFHIFPKYQCEWNWHKHVQNIIDNEAVWNGKRIISIGTGNGLVAPEVVQRQFQGMRIDEWVVMPNRPTIGETEPFFECIKKIQSLDPNEISFLGHTKGITHPEGSRECMWSDMMWKVCMDITSVEDALASHACAGPFKRHMKLLKSSWHYSGHFCWIRHKDVFASKWQDIVSQRAGMEAWLGAFIPNKQAACLFHDDPPISFLKNEYWDTAILPEFADWKKAREAK